MYGRCHIKAHTKKNNIVYLYRKSMSGNYYVHRCVGVCVIFARKILSSISLPVRNLLLSLNSFTIRQTNKCESISRCPIKWTQFAHLLSSTKFSCVHNNNIDLSFVCFTWFNAMRFSSTIHMLCILFTLARRHNTHTHARAKHNQFKWKIRHEMDLVSFCEFLYSVRADIWCESTIYYCSMHILKKYLLVEFISFDCTESTERF